MTKLAWVVGTPEGFVSVEDGGTDVVFADTEPEALELATHRDCANGCGADELQAKRAEEFDGLEQDPDELCRAQLRHGWHFSCAGTCERMVGEEGAENEDCDEYLDEDADPLDPVIHRGEVYCSQACLERRKQHWVAMAENERLVREEAASRWPGIEILSANGIELNAQHQMVGGCNFRFPGGKYVAHWMRGEIVVIVSPADLPAWRAYTNQDWSTRCT